MYNYKTKNKRYIEDSFDLEEYKKLSYQARFKEFREKNKKLLNIISGFIIFFSFVIAFLLYSLFNHYIGIARNALIGKSVNEIFDTNDTEESLYTLPLPNIDKVNDSILTIEQQTPIIPDKSILKVFLELREKFNNEDIVGFLKINDTRISYPVVHGTDNSFYLNHDISKKENVAGSIFMDADNSVDDFSQNTIVYGHNMKDQSMFHNVRYYITDENFYSLHKYITFKTLYEDTKWEIFSFYSTGTDFDYIQTNFSSDEFLQEIKNKSIYETGVYITPQDKILTLSTCKNDAADSRYVIHAKLIERTIPTSKDLVVK